MANSSAFALVEPEEALNGAYSLPAKNRYATLESYLQKTVNQTAEKLNPEPRKGWLYSHGMVQEYVLIGRWARNPEIEVTIRGGSRAETNQFGVHGLKFTPRFRIGLQYGGNDLAYSLPAKEKMGSGLFDRRKTAKEPLFALLNRDYGAEISLKITPQLLSLELQVKDPQLRSLARELFEEIRF
jgi:hypothetical protein